MYLSRQVMYGKCVFIWMIMFTDLYQWKTRNISSELNPTSLRKKKKPNKNKEQHQLLGRTCWEDNMVSERSCSGHAINYWWAPAQPQLWQLLHLAQQTACSAHGAHCLHPEPLHNQFCMHCTSQAISELRSQPCQTMKCRHLGKMCGQGQFDIPLA